MSAGAKWLIAYMVMAMLLIIVLGVMFQRVQAQPAWDGTWECRPGEVYTIKECP